MKNVIFFSMVFISTVCFAQMREGPIVKPGTQEITLDDSITNKLEAFIDKDDAILYMYRMSSFVGCAVPEWKYKVGDYYIPLRHKEYFVVHINTAKQKNLSFFQIDETATWGIYEVNEKSDANYAYQATTLISPDKARNYNGPYKIDTIIKATLMIPFEYTDFKPNKYYIVRFKGFSTKHRYLDQKAFLEIMKCKPSNSAYLPPKKKP